MTGLFLSAWILFPLLLLGVSGGLGLLVRRVSGGSVSGVLLLPVGFGLAVALCTLGTSVKWLAPATGWTVTALGVAGLLIDAPRARAALAAHERPAIRPAFLLPALAALVAFLALGLPAIETGTPTWTGFGRIVDTAFQMAFAEYLAASARSVPAPDSAYHFTILGLTGNGYPGGGQATLGALASIFESSVAWFYQPYLAFAAAVGALSIFALLRKVIASALLCALAAAVAIQANILYDYALVGGIKELTTVVLLLALAAVLVEWLADRPPSVRSLLPIAPPLAGALAAFSYGALPWAGLFLLGAFVVSLIVRGRRLHTIAAWALATASTVVLAIPTVVAGTKLYGTAKEAVQGSVEVGLGNLAGPVPEITAAGVWISKDYRIPQLAHTGVSHAFDYAILALAVIGFIGALWRRKWMLAVFAVTAPIAITYVVAHSGPWVELKGFTITAPMVLTLAFAGAGWFATAKLRRFALPVRAAGWLAALAVAGAVLYGNAVTYHGMSLASASRYRQLAQIGQRFAGVKRAFYPAFDEYSEMFLAPEHAYDLVRPPGLEPLPGAVNLAAGTFAYVYDLNQLELPFVESFPLIVIPRNASSARAPANFVLSERTPEFDVFKQVLPAAEVVAHLPVSNVPPALTKHICPTLKRELRRAGAGATIAYVPAAHGTSLVPTQAKHPDYWPPLGSEQLRPVGSGAVEGAITAPAAGTYEVWMGGSIGRPLTLYVDGRRVTEIGYQERYPGLFIPFGRVQLGAGPHAVRLVRGNGSLHAGSGDGIDNSSGTIGPLVFALKSPQTGKVLTAPAADARKLCGEAGNFQWLEVLRPGASVASG